MRKLLVIFCTFIASTVYCQMPEISQEDLMLKPKLAILYQHMLDNRTEFKVADSVVFFYIHRVYEKIREQTGVSKGAKGFIPKKFFECTDPFCEKCDNEIIKSFIIYQFPNDSGFSLSVPNLLLHDSWITLEVDYNNDDGIINVRYYYSLMLCLDDNLSEDIYENFILRENKVIDIEPVKLNYEFQIEFIEQIFGYYLDRIQDKNFEMIDICRY